MDYLSPELEGEREDDCKEELLLINRGGIRTRDKRPTREYRKCYAVGKQFTQEQNDRIEAIRLRVLAQERLLAENGVKPFHSGSAGKLDDLVGK